MSDILTDEQLYEHWSKYGGYQSSCDNVINDVKQEAYFDEEIIELLTIAKWLDAQRAALQARVAALEAALRAISTIVAQCPTAKPRMTQEYYRYGGGDYCTDSARFDLADDIRQVLQAQQPDSEEA